MADVAHGEEGLVAPVIDRRRLIGGVGLGVTSLALPAAASASSPNVGAAAQSGLPEYGSAFFGSGTADTVLAHWDTFVSGDQDWTAVTVATAADGPRLAAVSATASIDEGVAGQPALTINTTEGVYVGTGQSLPAAGTFSDVAGTGSGTGISPYFTQFVFNSPGSSLSLSASPYLEWSIAADTGHQIRAASLVIYKLRTVGSSPVNVAFYGSRDGFTGEVVLLRVATLSQSLRLLSIGLRSVRDVNAGQALRVRMYPYGMSAVEELRFRTHDYEGTDPVALDATRDSTDATYQGTRAAYPNAMSSFVGQVLNA